MANEEGSAGVSSTKRGEKGAFTTVGHSVQTIPFEETHPHSVRTPNTQAQRQIKTLAPQKRFVPHQSLSSWTTNLPSTKLDEKKGTGGGSNRNEVDRSLNLVWSKTLAPQKTCVAHQSLSSRTTNLPSTKLDEKKGTGGGGGQIAMGLLAP